MKVLKYNLFKTLKKISIILSIAFFSSFIVSAQNSNISTTTQNSTSSATTTVQVSASTTNALICDLKKKITTKKDKISKNITTQIKDKNKIISSMLELTASSSDNIKDGLDDTILRLEDVVSDLISNQKSIVSLLNSNIEISCDQKDVKNKKLFEKNILQIKKLEKNLESISRDINKIIKIDMVDIAENVAEDIK